ncbi:MAG: roadblock/LC7 domain-containing protein [Rubrobacter sp.]|nr:roadblock/LC7 domain-containing protein [Rubrobacter sp.]
MAESDTTNTEATPEGDLDRLLGDLRALAGDIESCAVLSGDGDLLSSSHGPGVERDRVTAMLGALAGLARRAARKEGRERAAQLRIQTQAGNLLMAELEGGATLVAATAPEARVGLVLYDMRNARREIEKAIEGGRKS